MNRKRNVLLIMSVLAILTLILAGAAHAASKTYANSNYGFSFSYPETWTALSEGAMPGVEAGVLAEPVDNFSVNMNVVVTQRTNVTSFTEEQVTDIYKTMITDFKLMSFERGTIAGEPCIFVKFTCTQGVLNMQMLQCLFDRKDNSYTLTFTALPSNYDSHESTFMDILDSFKF